MKMTARSLILVISFSRVCLGSSISESEMIRSIEESSSPQLLRILSKQQGLAYQNQSLENRLAPKWTQALFYRDDHQDPFAGQLQQKSAYGTDFGLKGAGWNGVQWNVGMSLTESENQIQVTPGVTQNFDVSTFTPKVGLDVDLWKNFWGHRDRNLNLLQGVQKDIADIEMKLVKAQIKNQVRKIYWDLSGVEFRKNILVDQIKKTDHQIVLMEERREHGLADEDDLAGFFLQKENLKIQMLSLDQAKSKLFSGLQSVLPDLENIQHSNIQLQDTRVVKRQVMACIGHMMSFPEAPMNSTPYDEWLQKMNRQQEQQSFLDNEEGEVDIHLSMSAENTGFSTKHLSDALSEAGSDKHKTSLMLSLAVPLGEGDLNRTYRKASSRYRWKASMVETQSKIKSVHEYTLMSLMQLQKVIQATDRRRVYMNKILEGYRTKYEKGRIPLMTLLDQEKQSLSLDMNSVDTKIKVIHILLQYFTLFPEFNCDFNQKVDS